MHTALSSNPTAYTYGRVRKDGYVNVLTSVRSSAGQRDESASSQYNSNSTNKSEVGDQEDGKKRKGDILDSMIESFQKTGEFKRDDNDDDPEHRQLIDSMFLEANNLHEEEDHEAAIELYQKIIDMEPEFNKEALLNMALCYSDMGEVDAALDIYERCCEENPSYATAFYNKGLLLEDVGRHQNALDAFKLASQLTSQKAKDTQATYFYSMGVSYDSLGDKRKALKMYDMAIELAPDDPDVWLNRGQVLADSGKLEEAIKSYKEALECSNQQDAFAWYNLGVAYASSPNPQMMDEARRCLVRCNELDNDAVRASFSNFIYGGEIFVERLNEERRYALAVFENFTSNGMAFEQDKWGTLMDVWLELRGVEEDIEWMIQRFNDSRGLNQKIKEAILDVESSVGDELQCNGVDLVVLGSSLGWQCFFGNLWMMDFGEEGKEEEKGGGRCVGYEILGSQVSTAQKVAEKFGLKDSITFVQEDARKADFSNAKLIWLNTYAWPQDVEL
eukprot:jgi/Bigna1/135042/aug1.27_g9750